MKKTDIAKKIQTIGAMETPEEMRQALVEFQTELEADYDSHENVVSERDQLVDYNKKLKATNKKLFHATGKTPGKEEEEENAEEESVEDLKYEDLFNEEGGLK